MLTRRTAHKQSITRNPSCQAVRCLLAGLLLTALTAPGTRSAPRRFAPPEANTIVRRMVAMYKKAATVQATFESTIREANGQEYVQSGNFLFKRPDQVQLNTTDPITGTFQAYGDGRTVTVFSGKLNAYTKRNTQGGLASNLNSIEKTSGEILGQKSIQLLSPLSFMLAKDMPREVKTFTYAGTDNVNGRKAYKVVGKMDLDFMRALLGSSAVTPVQRDIVLWIDAGNSQLLRSRGTLSWKFPVQQGGKTFTGTSGIAFSEVYTSTTVNGNVNGNAFRFTPPQGARQLFQEVR